LTNLSWYCPIENGIKIEQFLPITSLRVKLMISCMLLDVLMTSPSLFYAKDIITVADSNRDFYILAAFSVLF